MKVFIRTKRHLKLSEDLEEYIKRKINKFKDRLPEVSTVDIVLSDEFGPKGGKDKEIDLTLTLPGKKHTIHLLERTEDFRQSIDLIQEKLKKQIDKYKKKNLP